MRPPHKALAFAALALLALVWGYNWVVMKIAVGYGGPFSFAAIRTFGGALALFALALATRKRLRPEHPAAYFWIGLFQTGFFMALVVLATVTAGAGQVAMLTYTMPLWVSLMAWPALGERIGPVAAVAIAVAFAGILCMVGPRAAIGLPEALAVGAGFSWAIGIIISKRLQARVRVDVFSMTMWQMLFGGAVLVVAALLVPERATQWSMPYVWAVAYNIVFATALAYYLWTYVLVELPARTASMGTLANPVIGAIGAWITLHEVPTPLQGTGMLLILSGLSILTVAERFQPRTGSSTPSPQPQASE